MRDAMGRRGLNPRIDAAFAAVFPGQGAQYAGMGADLADRHPEARAVFARAGAALGFDLDQLCREGPEEALRATANTQPALLATSIACFTALDAVPAVAAGLSLGEYSALVCAGALELEPAVRLVRLRGLAMEEATRGRETMMVALMGLTPDQVWELCGAHRHLGVVEPANFNSPGQVVIGGDAPAVREAAGAARALGARRAVPLAVSAPFHTSLMAPAAERLAAELERTPLRRARFPVVANVSAAPVSEPDEIRRALVRQVTSPVLWEQSVRAIYGAGIQRFVEFGPGTTLCGMVRRTVDAEVRHVEDCASCEDTAGALVGARTTR